MDRNWPAPLKRAIAEIAEAAAEGDGSINDRHLVEAIDDDVLTAWVEQEGGAVAALRAIADQIEIALASRDQAGRDADIVQALVRNAPTLGATIHAALMQLVKNELADEAYLPAKQAAERKRERHDVWDDPHAAGRRALAREHNAIARSVA